ncbi:MAG: hypothetical protein P4L87_24340, partial [Formivibrio sp.]|nr:hypothetical protein [Formivibrio sp.]
LVCAVGREPQQADGDGQRDGELRVRRVEQETGGVIHARRVTDDWPEQTTAQRSVSHGRRLLSSALMTVRRSD